MLLRAATLLRERREAALATLGATLEPALIGALGIVRRLHRLSVFNPLYSLIGSVSS